MGKFISLFLKIGTLVVFLSFNSFAGGLEVSRQNNMMLFSEGTKLISQVGKHHLQLLIMFSQVGKL